jgi:hypothetical protein
MMADVSRELNEAHIHGDNLLFEGRPGHAARCGITAPIPT